MNYQLQATDFIDGGSNRRKEKGFPCFCAKARSEQIGEKNPTMHFGHYRVLTKAPIGE